MIPVEISPEEALQMVWGSHDDLPDDVVTAVVMEALATGSPWNIGEVVGLPWLTIALLQLGLDESDAPDFGVGRIFVCTCGRQMSHPGGISKHMTKCEQHNMEAQKMAEAFPTHPSNKTFIEQLLLWDGKVTKKKGDTWIVTLPSGDRVEVFAPTYHTGNRSTTFSKTYRLLGVTPQVFWEREAVEDVEPDRAPPAPPTRGQSTMVLDILIGQGAPMTTTTLATMTGLTSLQVSRACYYLLNLDPPLVRRLKQGIYEATSERRPDHLVGIDVNVGNAATTVDLTDADMVDAVKALEAPQTAPDGPQAPPVAQDAPTLQIQPAAPLAQPTLPMALPPVEVVDGEEMDDLIADFLDMVFPSGFTGRHLPHIDRWRAATKDLFRAMGLKEGNQ